MCRSVRGSLVDFAELVMKRRTVRRFEDTAVDREVLEQIARLAQHVPSAGFSQGQRLVIVTDPEQRRLVAETCGESGYAGRASATGSVSARPSSSHA